MPMFQYQCPDCGAKAEFYATPYQLTNGLTVVCAICGCSSVQTNVDNNSPVLTEKNTKLSTKCERCLPQF